MKAAEVKAWMQDHAHEFIDNEGTCKVHGPDGMISSAMRALGYTTYGYATLCVIDDMAAHIAVTTENEYARNMKYRP